MANKIVGPKNTKITIKVGGGTAVEIGGVVDINGLEGGSTPMIDATDLSSPKKQKLPGTPDAGSYTLSLNFMPTDTGQKALDAVAASRDAATFVITADGGMKWEHSGYVTTFSKTIGLDKLWAGSATIEIDGDVVKTYPASGAGA